MKLGLHVIEYPSGRFGFAGEVPARLAYVMNDGSPVSEEMYNNIRSFGIGLFGNRVKTLSFETREEAEIAAGL